MPAPEDTAPAAAACNVLAAAVGAATAAAEAGAALAANPAATARAPGSAVAARAAGAAGTVAVAAGAAAAGAAAAGAARNACISIGKKPTPRSIAGGGSKSISCNSADAARAVAGLAEVCVVVGASAMVLSWWKWWAPVLQQGVSLLPQQVFELQVLLGVLLS